MNNKLMYLGWILLVIFLYLSFVAFPSTELYHYKQCSTCVYENGTQDLCKCEDLTKTEHSKYWIPVALIDVAAICCIIGSWIIKEKKK